MGRPVNGITAKDRFWAEVKKTRWCWIWTGYSANGRYGSLRVEGVRVQAHRYSFKLHHGRWPKNNALHTCDKPLCVKPDHIYDGTQTANMHDWLIRRGRKITARQALWCKNKPARLIMYKFGVSLTHAYALRRGAYWRWHQ